MSCTCMTDLEKMIVETQPFSDLKVDRARFDHAFLFNKSGAMVAKPVISIELTCEGRKRPVSREVIYNHCPFCGKAYIEEKLEVES